MAAHFAVYLNVSPSSSFALNFEVYIFVFLVILKSLTNHLVFSFFCAEKDPLLKQEVSD
jgi:hypothetical protein